jgi:5-methylcytosine-specific restriction endonuclease McrA
VAKAIEKFKSVPKPTKKEVVAAKKGIARLGANKFRRNLVGNTKDRAKRRAALLAEFGDGKTCPCIYCGLRIGEGTLEQDKIITTAHGGRYRLPNLVPACSDCNKRRGDMPFEEAIERVVKYAAAS